MPSPGNTSTGTTRIGNPRAQSPRERLEWPTLALLAATYSAFVLLVAWHQSLPIWLLVPLGGLVVTLQSSLQHEIAHGHPTPWRRVNWLLAAPALWLWMPFCRYRKLHLAHHRDEALTDPLDDPESYYVSAEAWAGLGRLARAGLILRNTLLGRLLLGPFYAALGFWRGELRLLRRDPGPILRAWAGHLAVLLPLMLWVTLVAGMPLWLYLLAFAYPGTSLALLRSFLEHRAHPEPAKRTVIVEAEAPFALLFLNNNLHALHHAQPALPWYRLPERYRLQRAALLRGNGGYHYTGYLPIIARHLLRPKEWPVHPFAGRSLVQTWTPASSRDR